VVPGSAPALKTLPASFAGDPDRVMRFEREARTLAVLNHPHIGQIYNRARNRKDETPVQVAGTPVLRPNLNETCR
jgi:serine/threonine protein kinase